MNDIVKQLIDAANTRQFTPDMVLVEHTLLLDAAAEIGRLRPQPTAHPDGRLPYA